MGWTLCQTLAMWQAKRPCHWGSSGFTGKGHHQPQCHEIWTHRDRRSPVWTNSCVDLGYNDFDYNISNKQAKMLTTLHLNTQHPALGILVFIFPLSVYTYPTYIYIYVTIYNTHVFKFHVKHITLYMSFHKVIFFLNIMLLRFIHIYICTFSLLCSILFIYSVSCWWICRWFPVFPYYKQCYIGPFFLWLSQDFIHCLIFW